MSAEPVAITGVGCTLPGGVLTAQDLSRTFRDGRDCISTVPADRWDVDDLFDPDPLAPGKTYVRHGGFVDGIDKFDAAFFGLIDGEAERMDPQQRLLLQTVWHALEHAGLPPEKLDHDATGFFLAIMNTNSYSQLKREADGPSGITAYDAMGDATSIAAGRIAHFLDLRGPCFALDTACSGSLVAVHLARQSILAGECDTAIVAGVNAILNPSIHIAFSKVGLLSHSGQCRAFDAKADGYVRSDGCVAVVLRRESTALEADDHIVASVVGTAINHDGHTPALTAPSGEMQARVMRSALDRAGVEPGAVDYVEAHGTGTQAGDPIELEALGRVYGADRAARRPLYVGSAKSNFGHTEAGAGLLGLVKVALALDGEMIFPSLHFDEMNPKADLNGNGESVHIPTSPIPWRRGSEPRLAGVNSFGYSGTNAHALVREAPERIKSRKAADEPPASRPSELLVLSARASEALGSLAEEWAQFLGDGDEKALPNAAFTAAAGRAQFRHRLAVVGSSAAEISDGLRLWRAGQQPISVFSGRAGRPGKTAFVFTGQGSQYAGMGQQLYESEPVFAAAIDACAAVLDKELGVPLRTVMGEGDESEKLLQDTRYVQPAIFAVEYALAQLLLHWGIQPAAVMGHSVGEVVAACVAGALTVEDAARFVAERARVMGDLPAGGKMAAIGDSRDRVEPWVRELGSDVTIAAVNGPRSVVVSGSAAEVDKVIARAQEEGARSTELDVSHAFHSPLMDPIIPDIERSARRLSAKAPSIPWISNVTATAMTEKPSAKYWRTQVRQPVLFHEGVHALHEMGCSTIIEVGAHPTLLPLITGEYPAEELRVIPTLRRDKNDARNVLVAAANLFTAGVELDIERVVAGPGRHRVPCPEYPFREHRYWIRPREPASVQPRPAVKRAEAPRVEPEMIVPDTPPLVTENGDGPHEAAYRETVSASMPWADHRVFGTTVFPAAGYVEMAVRAFASKSDEEWPPVEVGAVQFLKPLVLRYGEERELSVQLSSAGGEETFVVQVAAAGQDEAFCTGKLGGDPAALGRIPLDDLRASITKEIAVPRFYGMLRKAGLEYGASFATVREMWTSPDEEGTALARVSVSGDESAEPAHSFVLSTMFDGCLHVVGAALLGPDMESPGGAFVPASIGRVALTGPLPTEVWTHVTVRTNEDASAAVATARLTDADGQMVAMLDEIELRHTSSLGTDDTGAEIAPQVLFGAGGGGSREALEKRLAAAPVAERASVVTGWLTDEIRETLGEAARDFAIDLDELDASMALLEVGLDSLLVTELQRRIQEKLNFRFAPMEAVDYQSLDSLAQYILDEVIVLDDGGPTETATPPALAGQAAEE